MPIPLRRAPAARAAGASLLVAGLVLATGCTDSLTDRAVTPDEAGPPGAADAFESSACQAVRDGIEAYNAGDLEESSRAFDAALPLARARADRSGTGQEGRAARALLEAVDYYAGLSVAQLRDAFPASPETQQYQVTTLGQCQPLAPGVQEPEEQEA